MRRQTSPSRGRGTPGNARIRRGCEQRNPGISFYSVSIQEPLTVQYFSFKGQGHFC